MKIPKSKTFYCVSYNINGELEVRKGTERTIKNPFLNLLDMVEYYYNIQKSQKLETMKEFIEPLDLSKDKKLISNLDMYYFITYMYLNSIDPEENDDWMQFDKNKLDKLLEDSFFDEYNRTRSLSDKIYKRGYPMLEVYSFARLQALSATFFSQNQLCDVNYIWTFQDFIIQIYDEKWYETISIIYKEYGIHWFANNGANDPIMYKWACYAVVACKKSHTVNDQILKRDLVDIYKELLIAFTIRGTLEKNKDIVDYVQGCITNFEEERINGLINNICNLKRENQQLIDDKKQLNEGIKLLRSQICEIQEEEEKPDYDKIEKIAYRIYCLFPQNSELDNKVKGFKEIWNMLDDSTKKDIKLSINIFEIFKTFDLALFPMIRSLEHEFARNFFEPFQCSKIYKDIKIFKCKNSYYNKTHNTLIKKENIYPTIGNILFIGKAIIDEKAQEASNLIKAFKIYLGDNYREFVSICKLLDSYKLGRKQYKLVDIRNGIAHGDNKVINDIDESCYKEVSKLLYEPPMQILFKIINHSMKK